MLCRMSYLQNRIRTKFLIPAVLLVSGAALVHAQRPQGGPAGDIVVDFIALDSTGQPATGLTPADVTIRIAGKQRTVTGLELKRVDGGAASSAAPAAAAAAPSAAPPPFSTNAGGGGAAAAPGGRTVLLVIDQESLRAYFPNNGEMIGLVQADEQVQILADEDKTSLDNWTLPVCDPTKAPTVDQCTQATLITGGSASEFLWADSTHLTPAGHRSIGSLAVTRATNNPF